MRISSFLSRHSHSSIPSIAIVTPIALACSTPAFCGEIHDATKAGNLAKVKALLKENPNLVLSKDNIGGMPLHWAATAATRRQHVKTSCRIPGMVWRKSEYYVLSFLAEIAYSLILKELELNLQYLHNFCKD